MLDIVSAGVPAAFAVPLGLIENAQRRLGNLVREMTPEELEYPGPAGNINSTAMLIAHVTRTDLEYLYQIKGVPLPPDLEAEFGPARAPDETLPSVMGRTVSELLQSQQRVVEMVRDYLGTQIDADALRPVSIPWWPEPAAARYVLCHMANHSIFHQGQIRRLREWYKKRPD